MIKVLGLSHKRAKKIYPRLNWLIFHEIYCMYSDTKNKEEINSAMILTSVSEHEEAKKVNKELEDSRDKDDKNQPIFQKMIIPSDINDIQPRATQVWNCDEVGFYSNGRWSKVIFTYKLFQGELMRKVKTGE